MRRHVDRGTPRIITQRNPSIEPMNAEKLEGGLAPPGVTQTAPEKEAGKRKRSHQAGGTSSIQALEPPVASQMARCLPSGEGMAQPT